MATINNRQDFLMFNELLEQEKTRILNEREHINEVVNSLMMVEIQDILDSQDEAFNKCQINHIKHHKNHQNSMK